MNIPLLITTPRQTSTALCCFVSFSTLIMSQRGSQKFPSRVSLHGLENEDQNPTHRYGRWLINVRSKVVRLSATGLPSLMSRDRPSFPMGALRPVRVCVCGVIKSEFLKNSKSFEKSQRNHLETTRDAGLRMGSCIFSVIFCSPL